MRRSLPALAALCVAAVALAGCTAGGDFDPFAFTETGRIVELNISVEDLYETPIYPGLNANLWCFKVTPFDANDAYSRNAIQYWDTIPGEEEGGTTSWGQERVTPRPECSVPAPTIVVTQGDLVRVHFSHSHVHPHTIHWHGQYVPPMMDGAPGVSQTAVEKGGSTVYEFVASRPGTLWYHCHVDTQVHQMQGLYGLFIVKPQDESREPKVDREAYMVLGTAKRSFIEAVPGVSPHAHPAGQISGTPGFQNPPEDLRPDVFMINGHSYPYTELQAQTMYHVKAGERLRLRILNAGTTFEAIHPHGHDMLVTHDDGLPLPAPYWVDTLMIAPAKRFDVVIEANNPGAWMIHTHVNDHETNDRQSPGGMHTMLMYEGHEGQCAECAAELPGGFPHQPAVFMPDDFENATLFALNPSTAPGGIPAGNANAHAEWTFPVELPCAVQHATVDAYLDGNAVSTAVSSVQVTVLDPDGKEVGSFVLGRDGQPAGSIRLNGSAAGSGLPQTLKGTYKVTLDGVAAQVTAHLRVEVDYYSSFEEMRRLHEIDATTYPLLCGKYGNGTDGLPTGA